MRCLPALPELGIAQHATSTSAAADLHYWPCCCTAPSTYVYNTNETTYFVLNTLPTTNKNAQRFCNDLGGHLAYYETFEQQVGLPLPHAAMPLQHHMPWPCKHGPSLLPSALTTWQLAAQC